MPLLVTRDGTIRPMTSQQAIDLISSLIFAAVWAKRRRSEGESGTKAKAMLRQQVGHVFTALTGRQPTDEELERLVAGIEIKN